jgi:2,4-dienoyl-CoA reductase-like NADH-dependent reductase (Old Yellow Enzyme family)
LRLRFTQRTPDSTVSRSTVPTDICLTSLTDYLNQRTDNNGGSPENRVRFAAEICRAVREAVGPELSVGIRISQSKVSDNAHRWSGGAEEAKVNFATLGATGIDFIHTTEYRVAAPAFEDGEESLATLAKQHSGTTVIANGNLDDPETAVSLLRDGKSPPKRIRHPVNAVGVRCSPSTSTPSRPGRR